jgi:hypothetical protein
MNTEQLIASYLEKAAACTMAMKELCGSLHPVRAWREKQIPPQGDIETTQPTSYSMHGIGCLFSSSDWAVDVDFDLSGDCGGFDAWRLWGLAKSLPEGQNLSLVLIETEIARMLSLGTVRPATDARCKHLLRLVPPTPDSPRVAELTTEAIGQGF